MIEPPAFRPHTVLAERDRLPRAVLAIATSYPPSYTLDWHEHRRAQLLYGATGTMIVETAAGRWTVPSERAVVIPPGVSHRVQFLGVRTHSLYLEPAAVPWWPESCAVVDVSPLLRELLGAAVHMAPEYAAGGRDAALAALLLHELAALSTLPFHVELPRDPALAALCRAYLATPDARVSNADWARASARSERALSRSFSADTGHSPAAWRLRARLLSALPRLREANVTTVAHELGYATPAAFTAAFSREFGSPPSAYAGRSLSPRR
ncbi:AraC family transcriptional regulator [Leucobacter chromiireducens]|uniref:AraC family transcriptional regulator n=1 Tax=Leucobacter chromiireducens subsp. solipictus TaxID=398235 RepID=A0ABS1SFX2_9MICO|nr:helix-turn-helix transcriptional regulator [Leucobacter chromiireducens]MBL3679444.1 AraC family transcriptional regulator [Leucobacter chromiireducens subsp. solipictus]